MTSPSIDPQKLLIINESWAPRQASLTIALQKAGEEEGFTVDVKDGSELYTNPAAKQLLYPEDLAAYDAIICIDHSTNTRKSLREMRRDVFMAHHKTIPLEARITSKDDAHTIIKRLKNRKPVVVSPRGALQRAG